MAIENEYCIIKDGTVINVIVADQAFAEAHASSLGATAVQRPFMSVGIGHTYHDLKFWRTQQDVCEGGMTHEGDAEPCPGGENVGDPYEVEITE